MASTNQSPFYKKAEMDFLLAQTDEERIECLEIMIKECPKHKSSENMLKNLTNRYKKLKESQEKKKKIGKGGQSGIKKTDMQCLLLGIQNVGKSTIFNILTQNNPPSKVSPYPHTTTQPLIGNFDYEDVKIQIIDDAPIPYQNKSLVNSTDTLLIVFDDLNQIKKIGENTIKSNAKKIYIFNKIDKYSQDEIRKISANLKSKYRKLDIIFFSNQIKKNELDSLKKKIFETFSIIRIYTKEPNKEKSITPMILKKHSTIRDAAEKILKGSSVNIIYSKIWGPSSKFSGQFVGIRHELKDKDVVEFKFK